MLLKNQKIFDIIFSQVEDAHHNGLRKLKLMEVTFLSNEIFELYSAMKILKSGQAYYSLNLKLVSFLVGYGLAEDDTHLFTIPIDLRSL